MRKRSSSCSGKKGLIGLLVLVVVVSLFGNEALFGQTGTSSVRGDDFRQVWGHGGRRKSDVSSSAQALERSAETGASGEYEFLALPPGTYTS